MSQDQNTHNMLQDIAALKAEQASLGKRLDKNESRTDHISKLAANLENLTEQLKRQNARWEKMFESSKSQLDGQAVLISQLEKKELELEKKFLERGAKLRDYILGSAGAAVVISIIFYFLNQLGLRY